MTAFTGSDVLAEHSNIIRKALERESARLLAPDERKSDRGLRRFSVRETAEHLKINYNSMRHYLKTLEGMPDGILEAGNRRTFSAQEIQSIQDVLFEAGKIPLNLYPRRAAGDEPAIISCYNLKGGVAKSSTTAHCAIFLAMRGFRVLLVDLDPQASLSDIFDVRPDIDGFASIYDVLKYEDPISMAEAISGTYVPNIDIVGGSLNMTEFEFETSANYMAGQKQSTPWHRKISNALRLVEDHYDVILFDTPPHMSFAVIAAVFASNAMLIPVSAGMLDIVGLEKFLNLGSNTLSVIEDHEPGKKYNFIRYLMTRYKPNDPSQLQIGSFLRSQLGSAMMRNDFLHSTAITDAGISMQTILELGPNSINRKTYERIYENMRNIADELEEEIMKTWGREPVKGDI